MYVWNPSNFVVDRAYYLHAHGCSPNNSHPGYGARVFYSWNTGQAYNDSSGYSNGITIGSHPGDTAYGWQICQNMWDDSTFTRRYNGGWQEWRRLWKNGDGVTSAVWNDYAECRQSDCNEFGYVLAENSDDTLSKTTERLQAFAGISSDTWGFSEGETDTAKTPIAVAGRVLAYTYRPREEYKPGVAVCAAPDGTVDIMTLEEERLWPTRIVGTVSCVPDYEEWGGGKLADRPAVKVNGRIWIKVR